MSNYNDVVDFHQVKEGQILEVSGMVHSIRLTKWGGFIILRKSIGTLQLVFQTEISKLYNEKGEYVSLSELSREMSITVSGIVNSTNIKDPASIRNDIELSVSTIHIISRPSTSNVVDMNSLKFGDNESMLCFKFDHRQVTLRNPKDIAIFKIQSTISKAFSDYLSSVGFTQIFTPKIVAEGAEGGANVFRLDYFDKQVYLAQSPQFYKQIAVGVFERVFEVAPCYRAEKHSTSRHLNEYISLDVEMGYIRGQEDVMNIEGNLLRYIINTIGNNCKHELKLLGATLPEFSNSIPNEVEHICGIPVWKLSRVHEILWENHLTEIDHRGEDDMAPEEERAICKYAFEKYGSDFVFITHFPSQHRAFYAMDDPNDPSLTISYDLLMRGLEITSGGQRMHEEHDYRRKMIERGMNPDNFQFYLDTFRNGMPPHGGFAIGLERFTASLLGLNNVKEASLFPRDINRVTP